MLKQTEDLTLILQCNKMKTMRATKAANRNFFVTRVDELETEGDFGSSTRIDELSPKQR